jgi:hypothetical protein
MNDFWANMIEAAKAENARGIAMRAGKRYTSAAVRLEIARRHLGDTIGVETEIFHYGTEKGSPVVVRATIRNPDGRIIAQGTAEEIRGAGNVNQTSALENAETSALGRALAMLGLSGGEFASANEMDGVERKRGAMAQGRTFDPIPDPPLDPLAQALVDKLVDTHRPPHDPETGEIRDERNGFEERLHEHLKATVDHSESHDTDSANLAAWKDGVLDALSDADRKDPDKKARALCYQFISDLDKYKAQGWLEKYIMSRRPVLDWLQASHEALSHEAAMAIARAFARVNGESTADFDPAGQPVILGELRIA